MKNKDHEIEEIHNKCLRFISLKCNIFRLPHTVERQDTLFHVSRLIIEK